RYNEFYKFLKKWKEFNKFPPLSGWPKEITLDTQAWSGIQRLYNLTQMDNFEYESSFFYVEGETFITTPKRGTRENVTADHSLQVKYEVNKKRKLYYQNVIIDGKVVSKKGIRPDKLPQKTDIGFLFNIHTHPEHVNYNNQVTYSFFSDTDIRSLIGSSAIVTGLVTDSFWLVAKTDNVISQIGEVGHELLYQISEKAFSGEDYLDEIIRENMSRWGLVFYRGDFKNRLVRIN
ncbi:hypothetical protein N9C96_02795, partial [bacterium]|nr:hypothetical protein [bacterium]